MKCEVNNYDPYAKYCMLRFKEWLFREGQSEDQALKLLGGDQQLLQQFQGISPHPRFLPVLAHFHREQPQLPQLARDIKDFAALVDRKKLPMVQVTKRGAIMGDDVVNYLQWSEKIHALSHINKPQSQGNDATPVKGKPIFSKNNIDVYEAHGKDKCIQYGKGYGFCISQPHNTLYQSYRDAEVATFYFVFDRNLPKSDPLHIVVVDHTSRGIQLTDANNSTGLIDKFGKNVDAYMKHLESKGVPKVIFKNIPHSEKEITEKEKLGRENRSLDFFKGLTHEERSKYIGRGHKLYDKQFDYLWDNKLMDLLAQYANSGHALDDLDETNRNGHNQFDKLITNSSLKKTYLRNRLIEMDGGPFYLTEKEWEQLDDKDKKELESSYDIQRNEPRWYRRVVEDPQRVWRNETERIADIEKMIRRGKISTVWERLTFGPLREMMSSDYFENFFNKSMYEDDERLFKATLKLFHDIKNNSDLLSDGAAQYVLDSALQTARDCCDTFDSDSKRSHRDLPWSGNAVDSLKAAGAKAGAVGTSSGTTLSNSES